jgi:methylamine dehydrogenase heavy chain
LAVAASSSLADTAPLKTETSDVATLGANVPHRFLTVGYGDSAIIYDGDTGQIEGQVATAHGSNVAWSPDASHIYVAETMWTHLNRGTKLSLLDVYDTKTLTLQKEIELPGRALVGMKIKTLDINASGKRAYVFDLRPASSVMWVNLETQKMGASLETPGCALVFAWGEDGVSSLCGDGTLASITFPKEGKPTITHSAPFFDAEHDPIFDNAIVDHATDTAQFLSYTGLIYTVKLGAQPQIGKPWSINESAGFKKAGTGVTELAWRPSGHQPFAWHKDSDRIFVLMHPGSYWSHVAPPTEIWVLNVKTHALLARYPLKDKLANSVESIAVTQKDKPQLIIMTEHSGHVLWNADTGEELRKIEFGQGGAAVVPGL